ncbi:hypothetical protein CEXT_481621, partial [Caerostris extrusa]
LRSAGADLGDAVLKQTHVGLFDGAGHRCSMQWLFANCSLSLSLAVFHIENGTAYLCLIFNSSPVRCLWFGRVMVLSDNRFCSMCGRVLGLVVLITIVHLYVEASCPKL